MLATKLNHTFDDMPDFNELKKGAVGVAEVCGMGEAHPYFPSFLILLASCFCGPYPDTIAAYCNLPLAVVEERADRLIANGVWLKDSIQSDWLDDTYSTTSFFLDVLVAEGHLERIEG